MGQPLGYYLSWSLFALSHHFIMWWAALRAYPQKGLTPFLNYAILGDDVVIGDSAVAREYSLILQGLQVTIERKNDYHPLEHLSLPRSSFAGVVLLIYHQYSSTL